MTTTHRFSVYGPTGHVEGNNHEDAETGMLLPDGVSEPSSPDDGEEKLMPPFAKLGEKQADTPQFPRPVAGDTEELLLPTGVTLRE